MDLPVVDPWRIYGLTCAALFVKMFGTVLAQGAARFKSKSFSRPEDAEVFGKMMGGSAKAGEDPEIAKLGQNALRNDSENIPIFLFLGVAYIQLGCSPQWLLIYMPTFVVARFLHTAFYLRPTQPFRNWSYILGQLVMMFMIGHIISASL